MLYRFSKGLVYGTLMIILSACTLFQEEKVLPEGKRISALGTKAELSPDLNKKEVRIRLPLPHKNSKWSQNGGNALHNMSHLKSAPRLENIGVQILAKEAQKEIF